MLLNSIPRENNQFSPGTTNNDKFPNCMQPFCAKFASVKIFQKCANKKLTKPTFVVYEQMTCVILQTNKKSTIVVNYIHRHVRSICIKFKNRNR